MSNLKLVTDALKKAGNANQLHQILVRLGVDITYTAVSDLCKNPHPQRIDRHVQAALVEYAYGGDWNKHGRAEAKLFIKK
jgi:hypothetical protein